MLTAASCTTNCLAPVVKVVHEGLGIRHGVITTIHDLTPRSCFGHTRFDFADVIPVAEGRGIYPELWLDEVDPVTFLRALPASR